METRDDWFTWKNRRGGDHPVTSILDRFLVSKHMVNGPGEITANVLPTVGSDHWPVCLSWDGVVSRLPKNFCFEQFWLKHKDFKGLVEQWWQEMDSPRGTRMYIF